MLYTIGHFATRTGLTPRALRLYDKVGLLPARRDHTNDHRYYTDDDIGVARRIGLLRQAGFSLRDIADLSSVLDDPEERDAVVEAFESRRADLARSQAEATVQDRTIRQLLAMIHASTDASAELFRLAQVDPDDRREMMKTLYKQSAKLSAQGPRERNEDRTWVEPIEGGGLYIVADGMGGHDRGGEASELACEVVAERLDTSQLSAAHWVRHLGQLVAEANARVHALGQPGQTLGTTLAVLVLHEGVAFLTAVGDSRIYRQLDDALVQLTRDHSVVQQRCDAGELRPDELHDHPDRNLLTSCVGTDPEVAEVFFHREDVVSGARYLLVSDGVTRALRDREICTVLVEERDAEQAVERLVRSAEGRTDDNATAIVVDAVT